MKQLFLLLLALFVPAFLSACGGHSGLNLGHYPDPTATPAAFIYCHGYGCTQRTLVGFTPREWRKIERIFRRTAKAPAAERAQIAKAIATMETIIAPKAGTQDDQPKAPLRKKSDFELDCIDEAINTHKFLTFLERAGLLKFHNIYHPVYKGLFLNGVYPHNSAAIQEKATALIFVVDSYIDKNGASPNIRPLESWMKYKVEDIPPP